MGEAINSAMSEGFAGPIDADKGDLHFLLLWDGRRPLE
jgi:hypothetical protein